MPPQTVVHTSSSFAGKFSLVLIGVVLGVVVALAGSYYTLISPLGETLIRNYFIPQPNLSENSLSVATSSLPEETASTTLILVPKAYASEAYYVAVNNVVNDVNQLTAVNASLGPVLEQLNAQSLSCNFNGFYGLMTNAQNLVGQDQVLTAQFGSDVSALSEANTDTTDQTTQTDTSTAVAAGQQLQQELESYTSELSHILAGGVPTSAQVSGLNVAVNATHDASTQFSTDIQALMTHFAAVPE